MILIKEEVDLKPYTTFGIETACRYFVEVGTIDQFKELIKTDVYLKSDKLILGGGSNILFTKDFKGLVIKNNLKGIEITEENGQEVIVKACAGEVWHDFVLWCINRGFAGIENLSLIPGCVGASPMQNIGAYGVEIKDVFEGLEALTMTEGELKRFTNQECEFGYRESVFKHAYKNKFFITSVSFRLKKQSTLNTSYGAINTELKTMGIEEPTIKDVSTAVIRIRTSKLPDPRVLGNAGSFFKNPEVSSGVYDALKEKFPDLVAYPLENKNYKLAAGWLIEKCGLKGFEHDGAAVHDKQALVIVNKNKAKGISVFDLSTHIIDTVVSKFGVQLEREVNIM